MMSKSEYLKNSNLYLILDTEVAGYDQLISIAKEAVQAGVDMLQLRDKHGSAEDILDFSKRIRTILPKRVLYIINDRVDLVFDAYADGVHIGQDDLSLKLTREILGPDAIIGVSCQCVEHAVNSENVGADYIGFGSVYKTLTKPDRSPMDLNLLKRVIERIHIPIFAIGGINAQNARALRDIGVERVAVTRAILEADNVREETKKIKKTFLAEYVRV